jgi:hypothetical protein
VRRKYTFEQAASRSERELARQEAIIRCGLCSQCRNPRNLYARLCDWCAVLKKLNNRNRAGSRPWREGGRGRPPKVKGDDRAQKD